ncbi:MAG: BCCT family transporter [Desulfovibrio sp.]|jgi:glycine betaine transporter|nr:BCCT family transporter [Desulfovibrio sp.]
MDNAARQKGKDFVYYSSLIVVVAVVLIGIAIPVQFGTFTGSIFSFLTKYLGWWYMLAVNFFVLFCVIISFSRFGKLKMGHPDEKPEFSTASWFAMLFGAGHGVGMVFYGVAEPLINYVVRPFGATSNAQAAEDAMRASVIHWGLQPWAVYAVIALSLAYFQFRKGAPGLISSLFLPLLGKDAAKTPIGRIIDIMAVFATIAGVATSMGLAVVQVNSGLNFLFKIPDNITIQLSLIVVFGFFYTFCTATGLDKGIKLLANSNLTLCVALSAGLLLVGPTLTIIETCVAAMGNYLSNLVSDSFKVAPYGGPYRDWLDNWTLYYWAWWIAWGPFVGSFVARISRGRTIREFVAGVLIVPTLGGFAWFSIFGGTALHIQVSGIADIAQIVKDNISVGIYQMYDFVPLGDIMSVLMMILLIIFLVTSASSSTYVLAMYTSEGALNPPKTRMAIWGTLQAGLAFVLLLTGGIKSLQTSSIVAAAPFSIIMVMACWCLWSALKKDFPEGTEVR